MRLFRRLASHSGGEAAGLLLGAGAGADVTRPESLAEILPLVDDGALSVVGQELCQLALHLLADFGVEELLIVLEELVDFLSDLLGVGFVGVGNELGKFGSGHRIFDGHEVGVEMMLAEKLHHLVRILRGRGVGGKSVVDVLLKRRNVHLMLRRFEKTELRFDEPSSVGDGHGRSEGGEADDEEEENDGRCHLYI